MNLTKHDKMFFAFIAIFYIALFYISSLNSFLADEGTHAVVSLFYRDLLFNIGKIGFSISNIYAFGMDYMVHYPKLQVTYPPLYHIVTGMLFYSVFGISALTAKISALVFSMLSSIALYFLVRKTFNDKIALLSTFLFFVNTTSIFYSYRALTDFSAWLFVFLSVYAFAKAIKSSNNKHFILAGILSFLATMGKRPAVILIVVLFIYGLIKKNFKGSALMLSVFILLMLPYGFVMLKTGGLDVQLLVVQATGIGQGDPPLLTFENWIWYFVKFIIYTGPLSLALILSLSYYVYKREKYWRFALLWFVVFWIGLSIPQNKEARFFQFIFLPAYIAFSYYVLKFKNNVKIIAPAVILIVVYIAGSVMFVLSDIKHNSTADVVNFIGKNLKGNVAVISERGDIYSSEFIFLIASKDANKEKFVYRPCAFSGMKKDEILKYMKDNNIEYVIAVNKGTGDKTFFGYENLEKIKNNLVFARNFGDIDVYKFKGFDYSKKKICNKICLTGQIICTNSTSPFSKQFS